MLSIKKTAVLAAFSVLALGFTLDAARAGDGRGFNRASAPHATKIAPKIKVFNKASYRTRYRGPRRVKAVRSNYRRWHGNPPGWAPPRKFRRKYRRQYRRWDRRRSWQHKHRYWQPHRHGADNEFFGTVIGAALGAIIGDSVSQGHGKAAVIVGGAVIGGIIGNRIGRSMDEADQDRVTVVLESSRTGQPVEWSNIDNGNRYTMTPTRTYRNARGEDCREFTVWGWIGGYEEKLHGTACRTEDGNWRTVT